MPRSNLINLSYGDIAPADMILELACWPDELSPAQMAAYEKAEKEHNDIQSKLKEMVSTSRAENLFLGDIFSAYQVSGAAPVGLEEISKPVAVVRKETRARQILEEKKVRAERERQAARKRENAKSIQVIDDDDEDEEYVPLSKRIANRKTYPVKTKELPKLPVRGKVGAVAEKSTTKPSENTAIGGLCVGDTKKKEVVDLTKDEPASPKTMADTREVTFNKLQGKTFPSLVVVARPTLKVKDTNINDRPALDAKVKSVLMHTATKYTEWLIQQGLIRSEQPCQVHPKSALKLGSYCCAIILLGIITIRFILLVFFAGIYSEASKFPYSGGYVWISDCCPSRYVSVFSGSLFEGASHPPSVLLKLIYHWSCQTNVQNVIQWVKVDNLYVKGLFTLLRSVCTVALHQHMALLGGPQKRIEVGVISLGTTSQGGQQKQVKVEVLGVLDPLRKIVRLRAVEPLTDGEKNYKKRFAKILEPLQGWVSKESVILTDLTVDKGTLLTMGFRHVNQVTGADSKYPNANIMEYLRTVVPRMFQNTLSLLSRQIIQQFLDELMWREWYGTTPGKTFDNIIAHISEQTRFNGQETLIARLNKVI